FFQSHSAHSPEMAQLLENMVRYYRGERSIQEDYQAVQVRLNNGDRFFPPDLYDALAKDWWRVPGATIRPEWAGRTVSRKEVAQLALQRLGERAAEQGIPENEVTKAMFEGRFNPYPDDLQLAFEGVCTTLQPSDIPQDIQEAYDKSKDSI